MSRVSKILEREINNIQKMYLEENKTPKEIGEFYNAARYQVNYILQKYGVQKSVSEAKREYTINEHFFDKIDTQNKAYVLGFLYADGYNNRINNTVVLSLKRDDEEILLKIREAVGSNKPLYHHDYMHSDGVERHMSQLTFSSRQMCEQLEKWGMTQAKTFTIDFPNFLSDDLVSHFIRGYFDGDGCVSETKDLTRRAGVKCFITMMSSMQLCVHMQEYLLKNQDIDFKVNHPTGHSELNGIIRSSSKSNIIKFINYIYKDAELYMERKHSKCLEILKKIS